MVNFQHQAEWTPRCASKLHEKMTGIVKCKNTRMYIICPVVSIWFRLLFLFNCYSGKHVFIVVRLFACWTVCLSVCLHICLSVRLPITELSKKKKKKHDSYTYCRQRYTKTILREYLGWFNWEKNVRLAPLISYKHLSKGSILDVFSSVFENWMPCLSRKCCTKTYCV